MGEYSVTILEALIDVLHGEMEQIVEDLPSTVKSRLQTASQKPSQSSEARAEMEVAADVQHSGENEL